MTLPHLVMLALLLLAPAARAQTSIALRQEAAVAPGAPVTLADVASIAGPEALALATLQVLPEAPPNGAAITTDDLRALLAAARVPSSRTTISGSACRIRLMAAPEPAPAIAPAAPENAAESPNSIRAAVISRLAQILQASREDLRLSFSDSDRDILDLPLAGRTLELNIIGASERISLALTLYDRDRIAASKTLRAGLLIRREVCIAAVSKRRPETIAESDFTVDLQWLPLSTAAAPRQRIVGAAVKTRLTPGEIITDADLTPPAIVAKGDQVVVRCLAGSVVVSTRARALAPARDGEIVQLQALDNPERLFSARIDGRGRAVLVATHNPMPRPERRP